VAKLVELVPFAQAFKKPKYLLYKWSFSELLIFLIWAVTMQALKVSLLNYYNPAIKTK
jgi:uncharacterized membrane protein YagU involved in acid resistance